MSLRFPPLLLSLWFFHFFDISPTFVVPLILSFLWDFRHLCCPSDSLISLRFPPLLLSLWFFHFFEISPTFVVPLILSFLWDFTHFCCPSDSFNSLRVPPLLLSLWFFHFFEISPTFVVPLILSFLWDFPHFCCPSDSFISLRFPPPLLSLWFFNFFEISPTFVVTLIISFWDFPHFYCPSFSFISLRFPPPLLSLWFIHFLSCAFFSAHASAPYLATVPLVSAFIILLHRTPDVLIQFYHPLCTIDLGLHPVLLVLPTSIPYIWMSSFPLLSLPVCGSPWLFVLMFIAPQLLKCSVFFLLPSVAHLHSSSYLPSLLVLLLASYHVWICNVGMCMGVWINMLFRSSYTFCIVEILQLNLYWTIKHENITWTNSRNHLLELASLSECWQIRNNHLIFGRHLGLVPVTQKWNAIRNFKMQSPQLPY